MASVRIERFAATGERPSMTQIVNTGAEVGIGCETRIPPNSLIAESDLKLVLKNRRKALVRALLDIGPVRFLVDLGKPFPAYRKLLNAGVPPRIKYRGMYLSFEEAMAAVPRNMRIGYDHEEIAGIYEGYANVILASDYPAILCLQEALQGGSRVFDFGGNVGISFYAWQRYLNYPRDIQWVVCDLLSVIQRGERLALERQEKRLSFTTRFEDANGFDFLLMSGCLQYVEPRAHELLGRLKDLPRHIVVNRIPLHDSRECVTLQNIRWMVSPYRVFHRKRFISAMETLGYSLVDAWVDAQLDCWIPFYPEYSVSAYSGLYFRRIV
jgi:putative methyltransferase (TIGR04325 family)